MPPKKPDIADKGLDESFVPDPINPAYSDDEIGYPPDETPPESPKGISSKTYWRLQKWALGLDRSGHLEQVLQELKEMLRNLPDSLYLTRGQGTGYFIDPEGKVQPFKGQLNLSRTGKYKELASYQVRNPVPPKYKGKLTAGQIIYVHPQHLKRYSTWKEKRKLKEKITVLEDFIKRKNSLRQ